MNWYAVSAAMTTGAAALGTAGTDPDSEWYRSLEKPRWQPPPLAFPLVWTPLYVLIGWGTGRLLTRSQSSRPALLGLVATDLAVNAGWCWTFFRRRSTSGGLAAILLLDALNVVLTREAAARERRAALALGPYVAWTAFASALNASIWRRNRSRTR